MWAEKEARNLSRMHEAGIRCPKPLQLRNHVLAMTFIGRDSKVCVCARCSLPPSTPPPAPSPHVEVRHARLQAAPRLRDADVSQDKWPQLYAEVRGVVPDACAHSSMG